MLFSASVAVSVNIAVGWQWVAGGRGGDSLVSQRKRFSHLSKEGSEEQEDN